MLLCGMQGSAGASCNIGTEVSESLHSLSGVVLCPGPRLCSSASRAWTFQATEDSLALLARISSLSFSVILRMEPRAPCMLSKCSTTELHPQPCFYLSCGRSRKLIRECTRARRKGRSPGILCIEGWDFIGSLYDHFLNSPDRLPHELTLVVIWVQWDPLGCPGSSVLEQGARQRHTVDAENAFLREEVELGGGLRAQWPLHGAWRPALTKLLRVRS